MIIQSEEATKRSNYLFLFLYFAKEIFFLLREVCACIQQDFFDLYSIIAKKNETAYCSRKGNDNLLMVYTEAGLQIIFRPQTHRQILYGLYRTCVQIRVLRTTLRRRLDVTEPPSATLSLQHSRRYPTSQCMSRWLIP